MLPVDSSFSTGLSPVWILDLPPQSYSNKPIPCNKSVPIYLSIYLSICLSKLPLVLLFWLTPTDTTAMREPNPAPCLEKSSCSPQPCHSPGQGAFSPSSFIRSPKETPGAKMSLSGEGKHISTCLCVRQSTCPYNGRTDSCLSETQINLAQCISLYKYCLCLVNSWAIPCGFVTSRELPHPQCLFHRF